MADGVYIISRFSSAASRIFDRLESLFGPERVGGRIFGPSSLRADFAQFVLVIIGREWLAEILDHQSYPLRVEIETALARKVRVIPVLVDGAPMPEAGALPESLKPLARLRPIELSSERFASDMERLEEALRDRPVKIREAPRIEGPFLRAPAPPVKRIAPPLEEKTARKTSSKNLGAKKASAKTTARKSAAKTGVRKAAAKKAAAKKTTARKSAAKKTAGKGAAKKAAAKRTSAKRTAAKKPAGKKAPRRAPEKRSATRARPRIAANQDLSVDEMKHLALTPGVVAPPDADRQPAEDVEEIVECSVFGPPAAPPGKTILIQAFLHLANQAERASFLASTMDASAKLKATKSLDLPVKRGARVEIAFSANGLEVDEPVQSIVWRGEPAYCQFLATIPAGTSGQSFFPIVRVSVDGKLLGAIKFRLSSDATASQPATEPLGDHAGQYKYAFVSYASKDRKEVLKRVQMLEVLKTKFFQDILSIDPGDRWEKKLYENIDRCDLFLLFWSEAAKESQWVLKEAEYALAHQQKNPQSEPDLVPVVLEQNVLPPPSLSAFHFNDRIGYLIAEKS
jgi:hypothetical protein